MPMCPKGIQMYLTEEERKYFLKACEEIIGTRAQECYADRLETTVDGIYTFGVVNDLYQSLGIIPSKIHKSIFGTNIIITYKYENIDKVMFYVIEKGKFLIREEQKKKACNNIDNDLRGVGFLFFIAWVLFILSQTLK